MVSTDEEDLEDEEEAKEADVSSSVEMSRKLHDLGRDWSDVPPMAKRIRRWADWFYERAKRLRGR